MIARWIRLGVLAIAAAACGHPPATPAPDDASPESAAGGRCVPFAPMPGYQTCLLDAPQGDRTRTIGDARRRSSSRPGPSAVDHRTDYLDGCLTVHDQGACGWCTIHATAAAHEAQHCRPELKRHASHVSEPHLWRKGHGDIDFDASPGASNSCEYGMEIPDAIRAMSQPDTYLVDSLMWPNAENMAVLNATRPAAGELADNAVHGADGWATLADIDEIRGSLASGHEILVAVEVLRDAGWTTSGSIAVPAGAASHPCACGAGCADPHCLDGGHAIVLTGYTDDATGTGGTFTFVNSWTAGWGSGGYGTVTYDYVTAYFYDALEISGVRDRAPPYRSISVGTAQACATAASGIAYCWGFGDNVLRYQSGAGSRGASGASLGRERCWTYDATQFVQWIDCATSPNPIVPARKADGFTAIAVGATSTCGLDTGGHPRCWGLNSVGQLGLGYASPRTPPTDNFWDYGVWEPTPVAGAARLALSSLTASFPSGLPRGHYCGLTAAGKAWCWGNTGVGQAGTMTATGYTEPVLASTSTYRQLSVGNGRTCGVTTDLRVECWGWNEAATPCAPIGADWPRGIPCSAQPIGYDAANTYLHVTLDSVTGICGVRGDGVVVCAPDLGQAPTPVAGLPPVRFTRLSTSSFTTTICAIAENGDAYCWSSNNAYGTAGVPAVDAPVPPTKLAGGPWRSISGGLFSMCGLTERGEAYCWGADSFGALGGPASGTCATSCYYDLMCHCSAGPQLVGVP